MNSRKRVLNYFAREKLDRVPIDYFANPGIDGKLKRHFGVNSDAALRKCLHADFYGIEPRYTGKRLHAEKPGVRVSPDYGIVTRWVDNEYGGYEDYCEFPLEEADEEAVMAWPMPSPDDYDYDEILEQCRSLTKDFSLFAGNAGYGCYINSNGFLRGMEQTFIDIITQDPAGELLAKRRMELELARMERVLDKCGDYIDFIWLGEDLGTQQGPLISMESYRAVLKPWHQKYLDLAAAYHKKTMLHTCGSSSWVYPEMIEMGLTAVDTLQPEANNMSPKYLKEQFGGKLCFHGCISTAGPVVEGTAEDVKKNVKETLEIMKPGYEYAFSPTHMLQDNTPLENVLAMYNAAVRYGTY